MAWYVSKQCTDSHRLKYVRDLAQHIDIDIYSVHDIDGLMTVGEHISINQLRDNYMFFLAFEEALCKDYITEKIWKAYEADVVPIVFGAANYVSILPPNSYIDVRDFSSPEALASHLRQLGEHQEMYRRYFEWRQQYTIHRTPYMVDFCGLCAYLHHRRDTRSTRTISRWYSPETSCLDAIRFNAELGVAID